MSKVKPNKNPISLLIIVTAVAVLVVGGVLLKYRLDSQQIDDSLTSNIIKLQSELASLKTCYDNNLKPCTDEAVKAYNKANGLYPQ